MMRIDPSFTSRRLEGVLATGLTIVLVLAGCDSTVSQDEFKTAISAAAPWCSTARFSEREPVTDGDPVPPDRIACESENVDLVGLHFIDGDSYTEAVRSGIDQPGVLRAFVLEGDNWLVTTDDRQVAEAVGRQLDTSPFKRAEYS